MTPTRKDIRRLDQDELDTLIRAFDGIQKLDPKDPDSFFCIAGYHGEPFRGAGWGNSSWWGGYCNHGNVLFRSDGIQKLDPKDPDSFFCIAGYHGEPFRGAGWGNSSWWGGYCNHGNVLF